MDISEQDLARYGQPFLDLQLCFRRNWGDDHISMIVSRPGRQGRMVRNWRLLGGHLSVSQLGDLIAVVSSTVQDAIWIRGPLDVESEGT